MSSRPHIRWRLMQHENLFAVNAMAAVVHPDYPESPAVFAERLALFATACWVATDEQGDLHGYAIAHPAMLRHPPALNVLLHAITPHADCLYLHDVALTEVTRGQGLGASLVDLLRQQANWLGVSHLALMAVNQSPAYWRRHGFVPYPQVDVALAEKIASYDAQTEYLTLCIAA